MAKAQILVVEDENIVAKYIQTQLQNLGYDVPVTTARGDDAVLLVRDRKPDLVLMDITLRGGMDGVDAAETIRSLYKTPVVYLTAHSDDDTLERAKLTEPFGYLLKPFDEHELQIAVEMALYKNQMEQKLRESEHRFATVLRSIGEAVIAADASECVSLMNPLAECLTGWREEKARGRNVSEVFQLVSENNRQPVENPVRRAMSEKLTVNVPANTVLVSKQGRSWPVELSAAPVLEEDGKISGAVVVFRDVTERRRLDQEREKMLRS